MPIRSFILFVAALVVAMTPAAAYWEYGHETVARIGLDHVRPATRAKIVATGHSGVSSNRPCRSSATILARAAGRTWSSAIRATVSWPYSQ